MTPPMWPRHRLPAWLLLCVVCACNTQVQPIRLGSMVDGTVCVETDCVPCNDRQDAIISSTFLKFQPPIPISELNTAGVEDDPSLTSDQLEIFFERATDLWTARRASITAGWGAPTRMDELNSPANDSCPSISPDGLTLYFSSTRSAAGTKGDIDVWVARRASRTQSWDPPQPVQPLNSSGIDRGPYVSSSNRLLVFASNRTGGLGSLDLYGAERTTAESEWASPSALTINSAANDDAPWMNDMATIIIFASDRPGGQGLYDLWMSRRNASLDSFGTPIPIEGINSKDNDSDPWLSPDLQTLYFSRKNDIYRASISPP